MPDMVDDPIEPVRIDRWLLAARVFKTRTLSQQACAGGKVSVNDARASAHRLVRVGDRVRVQGPRGLRVLLVCGLAERRLPAPDSRLLYEDQSPPPPPRPDPTLGSAPSLAGRPTKRDRRRIDRFRGR